jgi:hypothetical protein
MYKYYQIYNCDEDLKIAIAISKEIAIFKAIAQK